MSSKPSSILSLIQNIHSGSYETTNVRLPELQQSLNNADVSLIRNPDGSYTISLPGLENLKLSSDSPVVKLLLAALPEPTNETNQPVFEADQDKEETGAPRTIARSDATSTPPLPEPKDVEQQVSDDPAIETDAQFQSPYSVGRLGPGLPHLNPLGDTDIGAGHDIERDQVGRSTEFDSSLQLDNITDISEFLSNNVGGGLGHLVPLGDTEYADGSFIPSISTTDFPSGEAPPLPSFAVADVFYASEASVISGNVFANDVQPNPISGVALVTAPSSGALTLNADGTFDFTPTPGFSGGVTFTYSFYDTETGQTEVATAEIFIAAVAQAPIVSGGLTALEDSGTSALPISVQLQDTDGSETLEAVTVAGVPADVGFAWNTGLPGTVTHLGGGTYQFDGTTAQIQALLNSISITPTPDSDPSFNLTVTATSRDTNPEDQGGVAVPTATTVHDIPVTITAVADEPTVSTNSTTGLEGQTLNFGSDITYSLNDTDGSETVTKVSLGNFPGTATVDYTATVGASVSVVGGIYEITGTPAAIRAALDTFTVNLGPDSDRDFGVAVSVTVTDTGGVQATTTMPHGIHVSAVADAPTGAGSASGQEDKAISLNILVGLRDNDDSETIDYVDIAGLPAGGTFNLPTESGVTANLEAGGVWRFTGTTDRLIAALQDMSVSPPEHSDEDFDLTITVQSIESNPTTATSGNPNETAHVAVETAATSFVLPVRISPIADTPTVTAPTAPYTTNEDTSVALTGLTGALVDQDGSETLTFEISSVPPGSSFSNSSGGSVGTVTSPGVWSFTSAELAAGLTYNPPTNVSGDFVMTLTSIATEADTVTATPTASSSTNFTVKIAGDADAPTVTGSSSGDEDSVIAVGTNIAIAKTDTDGSETLTSVVVNNIPVGATIDFAIAGAADVSGTPTTLTITGSEPDIRATLASLTLTPPANSDTDINLSISATTTDTGGDAATTTVVHPVAVGAIADTATMSGGVTVDEDATVAIAVPVTISLQDTDGSEAITKVVVSGVPGNVALAWDTDVGGTVVAKSGGVFEFTGATTEIQDLLASLTATPPEHSDVSFEMTVETTVTETNPSEAGDVTTANATNSIVVPVVINAVADAPIGSSSGSNLEDSVVAVPITVALADTDGSESLQSAVINGIPTGWTPASAANSVYDPGNGRVTVTGTDAEIKATLGAFTLQPPQHSDDDVTLSVTVTSIESSPDNAGQVTTSTAQTTFDVDVIVSAVADTPSVAVSTNAFTTNEDIPVVLSGFNGGLVDTDGSEELTFEIRNVPTGASFNVGAQSGSDPTVWVFSATDIKGDGVNPPTPISFTPPANWHGTINMDLVSVATETTGAQIAVETASATLPFTITVNPILDEPVVNDTTSSVNEDQTIPLGDDLDITLVDTDGSQNLIVTLAGFPTYATPAWDTSLPGTVDQSTPGTLVITGPTPAEVLALVESLTVTETEDLDTDFSISITAETTEVGGATATATGTHSINVKAVADAPSESTPRQLGNEDTTVNIPVGVTLNDNDGSEIIQEVRIYNIPADATLGYTLIGTTVVATATDSNGTNSFYFTGDDADIQATLATLNIRWNDTHKSDDIIVRLRARSEETTPSEAGDIAVSVATTNGNLRVDFDPVADTPTVTVSNPAYTGVEDQPVALVDGSHSVGGSLIDTDGSETLSFQISSVPTGASFTTGTQSTDDPTVWLFTPAELAAASFLNPPNEHGKFNMVLTSVATEADDGRNNDETDDVATNSTPFSVTIGSAADGAAISGETTALEDGTVTFGPDVVIQLTDNDGSEQITAVTLDLPDNYTAGYTAEGSAIVTEPSPGVFTITGSEADIQATLDTFAMTPDVSITHSDANVAIDISVVSSDISGTGTTTSGSHTITVQAVADTPVATANDVVGLEDTAFSLDLSGALTDTDGSEHLSKAILTLPAADWTVTTNGNGTVTDNGDGSYDITADTPANFAAVLASVQLQAGEHISGISTSATLELVSTEAATGDEVATKTATSVADTFDITVGAVADAPLIQTLNSTGGSAGFEDQPIKLTIRPKLVDRDGSETLTVDISDVPTGATFIDGSNNNVGTDQGGGRWTFTEAELADLHIIPPLHNSNDFTLTVTAIATETTLYSVAGEVETATSSATINVEVIGVADTPDLPLVVVNSAEDTPIGLGASLVETTADNDGSETLSYIISGLPSGIIPSHGQYIGGSWQVSASDILDLTIPVPENFAGDYIATYAPSLKVEVVTQENDGNQLTTTIPVSIIITPVLDAVSSVNASIEVSEGSDISLANAAVGVLIDNDGSESVVSYTFDLNSVAGLDPNAAPTIDDLIASYITGTFVDNGDGTITVQPGDLAGIALQASAFTDSNVDFSIPVSVMFDDPGAPGSPDPVTGSFAVSVTGVADTPTAFADDVAGAQTGARIPVNIGGLTTDTDTALGRSDSEEIHYIVSGLPTDGSGIIAFTNGAGQIVGLNNGNGNWYLQPADLADLHITSSTGTIGTFDLTLTTFATENDGDNDQATQSTSWSVEFVPGSGGGSSDPAPIKPILTVNPTVVDEDGSITVDITAVPDPDDLSDPTISFVFSDLSPGATISGVIFNPANGKWFVDAANLGSVVITPDPDFAGEVTFNVEAVATNASLQSDTSGEQPATVTVTPIADGPQITATPVAGSEDTAAALNLSVALRDTDAASPEALASTIQITLSHPEAQLLDAVGTAYTAVGGVYTVPIGDVGGLRIQPPEHLHGNVTATITAESYETLDSSIRHTTVSNVTISFDAIADGPNATVQNVSGDEDTAISLSGLSASLKDTDGSETLSITISGIPIDSILSAGSNNGDGTWTLKSSQLDGLTLTPPRNYSGVMNLALNAYALEASNADVATTTMPFTVTVNPVADSLRVDPSDATVEEGSTIPLSFSIVMDDDSGTLSGETPAESLELTFAGVPAGSSLTATAGGTLIDNGGGEWVFTGTAAEAGSISFTGGNDLIGDHTISMSAVAIDGADRGAPVLSDFVVSITEAPNLNLTGTSVPDNLTGGGGDDTISGGDGMDVLSGLTGADVLDGGGDADMLDGGAGSDTLIGGVGADMLTGGSEADIFVWQAGDDVTGTDVITDFSVADGDVLDLQALLPGFDNATDDIADYVQLSEEGGSTTVQIDATGTATFTTDVVSLDGHTGLDLATLHANGNIII